MSFAADNGYIPSTIAELMSLVREGVNDVFSTSYDSETFLGTNFYKYFYALIQRLQENEVRTSEIVLKLQEYFEVTNEFIVRPKTTHPGLFDYFAAAGFVVSAKAPANADAGKLYLAIDLDDGADDYDDKKLEACTIIKDCVAAGVVSQGSEVETIVLSNNQSFDYKFALPDITEILLKLTLVQSVSNQSQVPSPQDIAETLYANINERYRLGMAFEPQRYYSTVDAPWAASIVLEYSINDGGAWLTAVYDSDYDEKFTFELADISVVQS